MKCFTKAKNVARLVLFAIFITVVTGAMTVKVEAAGGIAISGSFYRQHFRMVPGETFDSPDVNVVVFNNYDTDINVKFKTDVPDGVKIDIDNSQVKIPAKSNVKRPVKLSVADTVVPGSYIISISAELIPDVNSKIAVVSSTQLRSNLTVFGEAGSVKINTISTEGEPFVGKINLFYKDGDNVLPAGYSQTGELTERIIPGEYSVQAFWNNNEVATDSFSLKVNEEKNIKLQVQTAFIQDFTVDSQDKNDKNNVSSTGLTYTIKNIYAPIKNARICLKVYYAKTAKEFKSSDVKNQDSGKKESYEDKLIEEVEMLQLPTLEVGSQSGRGTYIPTKGWKNGVYRFKLVLYGKGNISENEILKAGSKEIEVSVNRGNSSSYLFIIFLILIISTVIWYIISKKRGNGVVANDNRN